MPTQKACEDRTAWEACTALRPPDTSPRITLPKSPLAAQLLHLHLGEIDEGEGILVQDGVRAVIIELHRANAHHRIQR